MKEQPPMRIRTLGGRPYAWLGDMAACTLAIVLVIAPLVWPQLDSWQQPGTGWHRHAPNAFTLRLLDSGRYVAQGGCATCEGNSSQGQWVRHGTTISLRNGAPPHARADFLEFDFRGCPLLVEERYAVSADDLLLSMAFARDDTACHGLGQARAAAAKPALKTAQWVRLG
jgi:hypothetical protein